jgi:hypothetical protein
MRRPVLGGPSPHGECGCCPRGGEEVARIQKVGFGGHLFNLGQRTVVTSRDGDISVTEV